MQECCTTAAAGAWVTSVSVHRPATEFADQAEHGPSSPSIVGFCPQTICNRHQVMLDHEHHRAAADPGAANSGQPNVGVDPDQSTAYTGPAANPDEVLAQPLLVVRKDLQGGYQELVLGAREEALWLPDGDCFDGGDLHGGASTVAARKRGILSTRLERPRGAMRPNRRRPALLRPLRPCSWCGSWRSTSRRSCRLVSRSRPAAVPREDRNP